MRVSTSQMYERNLAAMLRQQAQVNKTSLQMAADRRILTPADDPSGTSRLLYISQQTEMTEQYQQNASAAEARLSLEESVLDGVDDLILRVRELALLANNATHTNDSRAAFALELRGRLDELLGLANSRDASGEYLFSGYMSVTQPFSRGAGGQFVYNGDQGQRHTQIGSATYVAVGDPGSEVFMARNGNGTFVVEPGAGNSGSGIVDGGSVLSGYQPHEYVISFDTNFLGESVYLIYDVDASAYINPPSGLADDATVFTSGEAIVFNGAQVTITGVPATGDTFTIKPSEKQDFFTTVQNLIDALERPITDPTGQTRLHNDVNRALSELDQALGAVLETRARVGARLSNIDTQRSVNDDFLLQLETIRSDVEDLDLAEASARLNHQRVALEAAQMAYVKVQGLSLFNYL